jgi:hypothetical protein
MKNIRTIVATCGFILLAVTSCNNGFNTVPDGGEPCIYNDKTYAAKLNKIIEINPEEYDAEFILQATHDLKGRDTVYYSNLNNKNYISKKEKPVNSLVIGKQYSYTVKKIITGHCNPTIEFLNLNIFKDK